VASDDAIPLPAGIDLKQAAMVRINPPTALLLLTAIVPVAKAEWVIQDVANSAVGRLLIVLAKQRGIRTVNVVRRAGLTDELHALGADVVIVDGDDLPIRVREATSGGTIRLAIDALGGAATARLAECVANDGTVVHYGSMSGEDPQIPRAALVYRGVSVTGFMLGRGLAKHSAAEIRAIYAELAAQVVAGTLAAPVDTIYPIEKIKDALAHADKGGRNGKILVAPNGPI
jgi:NADPH:quinone reductase-like Zn-dependent oxidoreductase